MKKKNYWIRFSVLLVLIRFFSMVPVSAKWIIDPKLGDSDTASIGKIANSEAERVAYIEGDTDELGFTTIEAALAKATQKGGSQKVVVTANTTIKNDSVISKGVELVLPCDRTGDTKKTDRMTSFDDFYTEKTGQCVCTNSRSLKYKITLANKKKITIDGSLSVLGQFGGSSGNHTSYTFGSFSQLQLMNESQLVVNSGGKINCFGFITTDYPSNTNDNILVNSGGEVYSPLTIYDWAGGTNTTKYIGKKTFESWESFAFPFLNYDMANIAAPIFLKNGSSFYGLIQINSGSDNVKDSSVMVFKKALIVGKDKAFINVTSEHLVWQFSTSESLSDLSKIKAQYSTFSTHKTSVLFFGDGSIGSLSRKVNGISVNSADFMMPMNSSFSISINGVGKEVNISKMTIWMADSSLLISSGCKCIVSDDICFVYSDSESGQYGRKKNYSIYKNGNANISNQGNLQFSPNIKIAGKINGNAPSLGAKITQTVDPYLLVNGTAQRYKWSWKN